MNANAGSHSGGSLDLTKDPIWGTPVFEGIHIQGRSWTYSFDSPRCGGRYLIVWPATSQVKDCNDREKARLTSWLIEQRRLGDECPKVTPEVIGSVKHLRDMSATQRADEILKYLELKTDIGQFFNCNDNNLISFFTEDKETGNPLSMGSSTLNRRTGLLNYHNLIAYSESTNSEELVFLLRYLQQRNWIEIDDPSRNICVADSFCLTVEGYARLAEIREIKTYSSKGFMAMWFDDSMNEAWEKGFEPAIKNAGYEPMRIDKKEHSNKIDDEIITEIRRARFVVADFTYDGRKGVRGGVYYEAGFAHGLGIPVIFTCRERSLKKIHFDVRQYNCIVWKNEKLEELQKGLTTRITAIIGDGPGRSTS